LTPPRQELALATAELAARRYARQAAMDQSMYQNNMHLYSINIRVAIMYRAGACFIGWLLSALAAPAQNDLSMTIQRDGPKARIQWLPRPIEALSGSNFASRMRYSIPRSGE
jgi:hypothetical protein